MVASSCSNASTYRIEDIGPVCSIILGSSVSGQIPDVHRKQAIALCAAAFDSFTVIQSQGYFKGKQEESLLFQVATLEPDKVIKLAAQLAEVFDQEGVGIVRPVNFESISTVYSRVIPNKPITPM